MNIAKRPDLVYKIIEVQFLKYKNLTIVDVGQQWNDNRTDAWRLYSDTYDSSNRLCFKSWERARTLKVRESKLQSYMQS